MCSMADLLGAGGASRHWTLSVRQPPEKPGSRIYNRDVWIVYELIICMYIYMQDSIGY